MTFVSYAQNFEDVMLWRALKDVVNGFYIDVGANDPTLYSVTRAFYDRGWRGINVEPVKFFHDRLAMERPRDTNLNVAAGETSGTESFFDVRNSGLATSDAVVAAMHRDAGWDIDTIESPVLTLSEICREHVSGDIHFLKIDVEGSERQVLAGMDFERYRPWIVVVEATVPMSQQTSHETWESIVIQAGYRFVYFDGLNRYYVAAERGHLADAFSVPPNVFDDFVLNTDEESHLRANEAELRARQSQVQAQAANANAEASLAKAQFAESRLATAESELATAESQIEAAESRLAISEEAARAAAAAVEIANAKAAQAEFQTQEALARTAAAESRAAVAEAYARESQARALSAENEARIASGRAREAEATARSAVAKGLQLRQRLRATELIVESNRRELSLRQQSLDARSAEAAQLWRELGERDRLLAEIHASFSVRVTAPIRFVASLIRRGRSQSAATGAVAERPRTDRIAPLAGEGRRDVVDVSPPVAERAPTPVSPALASEVRATRIDPGFVVPYDPRIDAARLAAAINRHIDRVD